MRRYDDGYPPLLSYQTAWNAERAPVSIAEKARRIGLSWGTAAEDVTHAAANNGNVHYMSFNKDMTETYIEDCAFWAREMNVESSGIIEEDIIVDKRDVKKFRIDFPGGNSIISLPSNPRVVRSKGRPGELLNIDEAAFCDDLRELLKAAIAMTQWGGRVRIMSTHNGEDNPFNEMIRDARAGKVPFPVHRTTIDDAIDAGLARRICSVKGDTWTHDYAVRFRAGLFSLYRHQEDADEEMLCIPRYGGGVWLSRVLVESRMEDVPQPIARYTGSVEFNGLPEHVRRVEMQGWLDAEVAPLLRDLDPNRRHVIGGDFARSGDMSSYAPIEIGATLKRRCPFLMELKNVPHKQQEQAVTYLCDRLPRFSGGAFDAQGNGNYLAEAMHDAYGSVIDRVYPSEAWYREHMPPFKAAFEDDRITVPRHEDVLDDLRAFRTIRGVPRLPEGKTDRAGQRHGDAGMALALAWHASENAGSPIGGMELPPRAGFGAFAGDRGAGRGTGYEMDPGLGIVHGPSAGMGGFS